MIRTPVGSTGSFIFEVGAVDKLAEPKKRLIHKKTTIEFDRFVEYALVTSIQCCLFWVTHPQRVFKEVNSGAFEAGILN